MRFIIDFAPETAATDIQDYLAANQLTVVGTYSALGLTHVVEGASIPNVTGIVQAIVSDTAGVELLETKTFVTEAEDNWWKLAVIQGLDFDNDVSTITRAGHDVRVYLMDSGIDASHPEFAGKSVTPLWSKTGEFSDSNGHGTALASVIVGETCGITEADLRIVKIFEKNQPTLVSEVLAGLDAVAQDYQADTSRPAILNCSWSITRNHYVEAKLLALMQMGVYLIASAGNSGVPVQDVTPAAMVSAITVGAFNDNLVPCDFTNYTAVNDTSLTNGATNFGPGLDVFAPGQSIRIAKAGGGYGFTAGTSVAAAITSAVTALNLAILGGEYDYDLMLGYFRGRPFVANGLLTLTGQYQDSPNYVPTAQITPYQPGMEMPPLNIDFAFVQSGAGEVRRRIASGVAYDEITVVDSGVGPVTVDGNWIEFEGMTTATQRLDVIEIECRTGEHVDTIFYRVLTWNADAYPSPNEAAYDAQLVLNCDCGSGGMCCSCLSPKHGCDWCSWTPCP